MFSSVDVNRVSGLIKSFFQDRQYGFILYEDENGTIQEVFYHITEFRANLTPQAGQIAEFYLSSVARGLRATDCVLLRNNPELYKIPRFIRLNEALQKTFSWPTGSRNHSSGTRPTSAPPTSVPVYDGTAVPQPVVDVFTTTGDR